MCNKAVFFFALASSLVAILACPAAVPPPPPRPACSLMRTRNSCWTQTCRMPDNRLGFSGADGRIRQYGFAASAGYHWAAKWCQGSAQSSCRHKLLAVQIKQRFKKRVSKSGSTVLASVAVKLKNGGIFRVDEDGTMYYNCVRRSVKWLRRRLSGSVTFFRDYTIRVCQCDSQVKIIPPCVGRRQNWKSWNPTARQCRRAPYNRWKNLEVQVLSPKCNVEEPMGIAPCGYCSGSYNWNFITKNQKGEVDNRNTRVAPHENMFECREPSSHICTGDPYRGPACGTPQRGWRSSCENRKCPPAPRCNTKCPQPRQRRCKPCPKCK